MRKIIVILILIIASINSIGQDGVFSRVIAKQAFFLRDTWVDSLRKGILNWQNDFRTIPTSGAVYDFVIAHGSGGSLIYNESVIKSNDSVFLRGEKIYPRRANTYFGDSASIPGFHNSAIIDFNGAQHGYELWYDTTGTAENGYGIVSTRVTDSTLYLNFTVGDNLAPNAGDSILIHSQFYDKVFTVFREGDFQHYNSLYGITVNADTLFFHPPLFTDEKISIRLNDSTHSSQLSLECIPVDMDFDITCCTVSESPANKWNYFTTGDYAGNSLTSMASDGYFQGQIPSGNSLVIGLDTTSSADFYYTGGISGTATWVCSFFVFSGTIYAIDEGQSLLTPTSLGSVTGYTHFRISRTGSATTLKVSTDGVTFTTIHTYATSSTSNFYVKTNRGGSSNALFNPKTCGFE